MDVVCIQTAAAPWVAGDAVSSLVPPSRNPGQETRHPTPHSITLGEAVDDEQHVVRAGDLGMRLLEKCS